MPRALSLVVPEALPLVMVRAPSLVMARARSLDELSWPGMSATTVTTPTSAAITTTPIPKSARRPLPAGCDGAFPPVAFPLVASWLMLGNEVVGGACVPRSLPQFEQKRAFESACAPQEEQNVVTARSTRREPAPAPVK